LTLADFTGALVIADFFGFFFMLLPVIGMDDLTAFDAVSAGPTACAEVFAASSERVEGAFPATDDSVVVDDIGVASEIWPGLTAPTGAMATICDLVLPGKGGTEKFVYRSRKNQMAIPDTSRDVSPTRKLFWRGAGEL